MDMLKTVSLNIAKDLILSLIEQRVISPENLSETLTILSNSAKNNFANLETENGALVMRLAKEITVKIIEHKLVSSAQDVATLLTENTKMITLALKDLSPENSQYCLTVAKELTLKLFEINRLSINNLPEMFFKLTETAHQNFK